MQSKVSKSGKAGKTATPAANLAVVEVVPVTYQPTIKPDGVTPYGGDKFTVRVEAKGVSYIGDEGYVVPRSFAEFESQEPHYIRRWVQKKLHRNMVDDDVLDWAADLSLHMRYLPENSVGRQPGYNEANPDGCTDLIQCFNPYSCFGASKRRFLFYVNRCLANRFSTIHSKNLKNPIMRDGNLVYDPTATAEEMAEHPGMGGEEYIHANSDRQRERLHRAAADSENKLFLKSFRSYLAEHEPTLIPMMAAIAMAETQEEAQNILGITSQVFHHNKKRLKVLGECFKEGTEVPVWRKYKRHIKPNAAIEAAISIDVETTLEIEDDVVV